MGTEDGVQNPGSYAMLKDDKQPSNAAPCGCVAAGYQSHGTRALTAWQHLSARGHVGQVNAVKCCAELDYLVTGGEDGTMRIWEYKGNTYDAYELAAVVVFEFPKEDKAQDEEAGKGLLADCLGDGAEDEEKEEPRRGVTSVACVGTDGPFIGATHDGQIAVFSLKSGRICKLQKQPHAGAVNDMCTLPSQCVGEEDEIDDPAEGESAIRGKPWVLATAGEDGKAFIRRILCSEGDEHPDAAGRATGDGDVMEEGVCELKPMEGEALPGPVLQVAPLMVRRKALSDEAKGGACFATCTEREVQIWNLAGEELIKVDGCSSETPWQSRVYLATDIKESGSLLFAGAEQVGVWVFDRSGQVKVAEVAEADDDSPGSPGAMKRRMYTGELSSKLGWVRKSTDKDNKGFMHPAVVYPQQWSHMTVDQSSLATDFVAVVQDDWTVTKWGISACEPEMLALEPPGPEALLVNPGREDLEESLAHPAKITSLTLGEDPDETGGSALVVGQESGAVVLWDMCGEDSGQIYAELRSLRKWEIIMLPLNLVFGSLQMLSFAFGPTIPWTNKAGVRETAHSVHEFAMLDFHFSFALDRPTLFWCRSWLVVGIMILFSMSAVLGVPEALTQAMLQMQLREKKTKQDHKGSGFSPYLFLVSSMLKAARLVRSAWFVFIQLCSTVLVVTLFKAAVKIVDCTTTCDGKHVLEELHVLRPPVEVVCMEGNHRLLVLTLALVMPAFFYSIIPMAVVNGNMSYATTGVLLNPRQWTHAAHRKATMIHFGIMHTQPKYAFLTLLLDLLAKIALPTVTTLTNSHAKGQMMCLIAISSTMYLTAKMFPPFLFDGFRILVEDLRLLSLSATVLGATCLFMTEDYSDPKGWLEPELKCGDKDFEDELDRSSSPMLLIPLVLLVLTAIAVVAHIICGFRRSERSDSVVLRAVVSPQAQVNADEKLVEELQAYRKERMQKARNISASNKNLGDFSRIADYADAASVKWGRLVGFAAIWCAGCLVGWLLGRPH